MGKKLKILKIGYNKFFEKKPAALFPLKIFKRGLLWFLEACRQDVTTGDRVRFVGSCVPVDRHGDALNADYLLLASALHDDLMVERLLVL